MLHNKSQKMQNHKIKGIFKSEVQYSILKVFEVKSNSYPYGIFKAIFANIMKSLH